jgi:hypothetical protein
MKKLSLYITLALSSLMFASCGGDDYEGWADPQSNAEENAITIPGYTATAVSAINFADVTDDSIAIYTLNDATLPTGYTLTDNRVVFTPSSDGALSTDTTTMTTSTTGKVAVDDLISLVQTYYGKAPTARTFSAHVYADAKYNGTACLIDAGTVDVTMTLQAPKISSKYYVIGGAVDWTPDAARTQVFSHSSTNVYDDPVFTITIPAASGDTWFAIADDDALNAISASNDWSQVLGTTKGNGGNAYDGTTETLDYRANLSDDGSFKVPSTTGAKYIRVTINMMDATYSITPLSFQPTMYVAGGGNNWNQIDYLTTSTYDGNYDGYMYLNTEFKICTQQNWNGTNYGAGFSTDVNAGNMTVNKPGYYKVHVNLVTYTLELTPISTIGVVGDATGSWDVDKDMTYNETDRCWEIDNLTLTDGEIKFRANDGWDINWGGTADALIQGGDNIAVTAGTYSIKLYAWADGFAKCTITKQ